MPPLSLSIFPVVSVLLWIVFGGSSLEFAQLRSVPFICVTGNRRPHHTILSVPTSLSLHTEPSEQGDVAPVNSKKKYGDDRLRRKYLECGGILYRKTILSAEEMNVIRSELFGTETAPGTTKSKTKIKTKRSWQGLDFCIKLFPETLNSVAWKRIGAVLPRDANTIGVLSNPASSLSKLVNRLMTGVNYENGSPRPMVLSRDIPVEVRVYEKIGAGMEWHVDDVLFDEAQVEVVLTLENTSDCVTMWEAPFPSTSATSRKGSIREAVETEPNSALLILAGGARHCVSPLKSGRRVVLKFVFVREGAKMLAGSKDFIQQFGGMMRKKGNAKKKHAEKRNRQRRS